MFAMRAPARTNHYETVSPIHYWLCPLVPTLLVSVRPVSYVSLLAHCIHSQTCIVRQVTSLSFLNLTITPWPIVQTSETDCVTIYVRRIVQVAHVSSVMQGYRHNVETTFSGVERALQISIWIPRRATFCQSAFLPNHRRRTAGAKSPARSHRRLITAAK